MHGEKQTTATILSDWDGDIKPILLQLNKRYKSYC